MTSWLGLQNFLMEFYQVYEKPLPNIGLNLFEKAKYFCGKNVSTEEF